MEEMEHRDGDPYSACLSRINMALQMAMLQEQEMSQEEYDRIKAIRMECEAADPLFDWTVIP